jgi:hypothetical protein
MILVGFSLGSAAEVLDDDAREEGDGVEVGFGFRDGYDLAATAREATEFKSAPNEAVA